MDGTGIGRAGILVVGLNVTGRACANVLPEMGARVWVTDTRESLKGLEESIRYIESRGARFAPAAEAAGISPDIIVVSPGISMKDSRLDPFRNSGAEWMSEIELGWRICRGKILAVTGTNGKTTCATLAGKILASCFKDVRVSGNIGSAFIEAAAGSADETIHVVEVSSYQLEGCKDFAPRVGIVLNVQPDHQSRHPTLEEYAAAKSRLLQAMRAEDIAVLCHDDELVRNMAARTKAGIAYFSSAEILAEGAFASGEELTIRWEGKEITICRADEMKLRGAHNVQNALAVSMGTLFMGAPVEMIRKETLGFETLEHRIETVAWINGVECVNDSKGTNVDSVLAALDTFPGREITLILCGDDKGIEYGPLYARMESGGVKALVMGTGLSRVGAEIERRGTMELRWAGSMREAVETGLEITREGGVLLLSPSSSSFDMYRNYEERGRDFRNEIDKKKNC